MAGRHFVTNEAIAMHVVNFRPRVQGRSNPFGGNPKVVCIFLDCTATNRRSDESRLSTIAT
jgi:hypothetical protein